ncbi:MAG: alpha/beta fold hydrolase [Acidobacteriota bacterium]|nr:alpha/beta fold hydrolase [Acidobacteriota bacterium]
MRSFSTVMCCGLASTCLLSTCAGPDSPAPEAEAIDRPSQLYSIQEFLGTTRFSGASFSPDASKILVSSNATGIVNAYSIPVGGGEPTALTQSRDESIFSLSYFPDDERFLYTADQGGNELNHVFVKETSGTVVDLTPGEDLKATFYGFAHDDQTFFVGSTERDPRFVDIYEYQTSDYSRELFYRNEEGMNLGGVAPDRRHLVLSKIVSNADIDLYLHDRSSGETELVTGDPEEVINRSSGFSPDGKYLYYTTDRDREFTYLARLDLETGDSEKVLEADWDISFSTFSKTGRYLTVGINADARTELRFYEAATMTPVPLPELPDAEISSVRLADDEKNMAFYASSGRIPRDLFYAEIGGSAATQLTTSLPSAIDEQNLVEGTVARFASYDGLDVPGILYRPHQASTDNPVPALVWVHGGPGGQSRLGYIDVIQYLVNHGVAIYAINNRGSSGYGKTFYHLDDRKHGDADLDDVVASKQMLIDTGWVDPEAIGIIGGSYGGYMTLAALTFRPDAFALGVDLFGISNWYRTVQNIPPWWEAQRTLLEREMGDFDDEEFFRAKSPLFHASNITKPLMVLQGANDPRVLKVESDEIVEAVRANGVPVEYVLFDDEGHGFVKKQNQAKAYEAILSFLDEHLAKPVDPSADV